MVMQNIIDAIVHRVIREVYRLGGKPSLSEIVGMVLDELENQKIVINEKQLSYIESTISERVWYL